MGYGYQNRDYEIIDYKLWHMDDIRHAFRGPSPECLDKNQYFVCLGAAQTFGCFCEKPFPTLLSEKLSFDVLNISHAGAGPMFYLQREKHIQLANNAKFVILQVMSGRSESNSIFESKQGRGLLERRSDKKMLAAEKAYNEFLQTAGSKMIIDTLIETRENYVKHMIELLNMIKVPKVLFWFSERKPEYVASFENARGLFGKYPQFVNKSMIDQFIHLADYYVESVSSEGLPQPLFSRFTGNRVGFKGNNNTDAKAKMFNTYYPSPKMHEHAFSSLVNLCTNLIDNG
jgi:hypothetical protein